MEHLVHFFNVFFPPVWCGKSLLCCLYKFKFHKCFSLSLKVNVFDCMVIVGSMIWL